MKTMITISAAMLFALSLTACDNNNDQDNAPADSGAMTDSNAAGDSQSTGTTGENLGSGNQQMPGDEQGSGDGMSGSSMDDGQNGNSDEYAPDDRSQDDAMNTPGGQSDDQADRESDNQASSEDMPRAAVAVLQPTEGNEASATVRFTAENGGLSYTTQAKGLTPGKHGYHIHLYGDCSAADGTSAGTHFNLKGSSRNPPKDIDRITGNLGALDAGDDGTAEDEGTLDQASLTGAKAIIGRSIIIHAKDNDPSQPPIGAAGPRQACGVIGAAKPKS